MSARQQLLESLGSKPEKPVKAAPRLAVPPRFVADFELVATRYQLRECGEYDEAKEAARNDIDAAMTTFAALAGQVQEAAA